MATDSPRKVIDYDQEALEYSKRLTEKDIMESWEQAFQRRITLASLAFIKVDRHDVQFFNEMLVQYPNPDPTAERPGQVVPDNMVVLHHTPLRVSGHYAVERQPARPFWVLEYVSRNNQQKDYDANLRKYERELQVPYFLLFNPEIQELILYRHTGEKYATVLPNAAGRYPVPELEMEVGLLEGWVRFWFRGELQPLNEEAKQQLTEIKRRFEQERQRADQAERRADQERQRADSLVGEVERLRAMLAQRGPA